MTKLRHDDPIQIDRFCTWVRQKLSGLTTENNRLKDLIQQLRNKPDTVYDPPNKANFKIKVGRSKIDLTTDISDWHTNHFIRYFQQRFERLYAGEEYKIEGRSWQAHPARQYAAAAAG